MDQTDGDGEKGTDPQKHNMRAYIVHGAVFRMATAFAEPFAVVPVFLRHLTGSNALVGAAISIIQAGSSLPQLFVAEHIRRGHRGKPLLLAAIWTRCIVWGILALWAFLMPVGGSLLLVVTVILLSVFSLAGGIATVPFSLIISETIPESRRGSLFGTRQLLGGILAILAGLLVRQVLGNPNLKWPVNYSVLFAASFLLLIVAYTSLSMVREPAKRIEAKPREVPMIREALGAIKSYPALLHLVATQTLASAMAMSLPFLTIYSSRVLGLATSWIGIFVSAQMFGGTVSNLLWIPLQNRRGARSVIRISMLAGSSAVLLAIFAKGPLAFVAMFILIGIFANGNGVGFSSFVLELGTSEIRPLLIAINGTLLFPTYFLPFLGGALTDHFGFTALFTLSSLMGLFALILSIFLCEPRHPTPACGPAVPKDSL